MLKHEDYLLENSNDKIYLKTFEPEYNGEQYFIFEKTKGKRDKYVQYYDVRSNPVYIIIEYTSDGLYHNCLDNLKDSVKYMIESYEDSDREFYYDIILYKHEIKIGEKIKTIDYTRKEKYVLKLKHDEYNKYENKDIVNLKNVEDEDLENYLKSKNVSSKFNL